MSAPTLARAAPVTPTVRQSLGRWRFAVVAVVLVLLGTLAVALVSRGGSSTADFAPDNAHPAGGRALAQVLTAQGVQVRSVGRLAAAIADPQSTLLVDDSAGLLTAAQWRRVLASTGRLIVVGPAFTALRVVAPGVDQSGLVTATTVRPGCTVAAAVRSGALRLPDTATGLRLAAGRPGSTCYRAPGEGAQLVRVRTGETTVLLLASSAPFTNEHIAVAGNAALALNLLGATPELTWYRPSPLDVPGAAAPTLADLTPAWVTPLAILLLLAGVAATVWRGRRFGPLVVERLPVIVRARETVEGRARLYQRGGDRLRAADALRIGVLGRIAPLLGLSRRTDVEDVARAAAAATGRPAAAVRDTLLAASPGSERDLIALSDRLADLERAVRAAAIGPTRPTTPAPQDREATPPPQTSRAPQSPHAPPAPHEREPE
ncbi:DUF4350 domain-containing protein [uncultured Amnibacterium sp.]|uniref:DUF4350 domain-containing protein n=1 Tax=uncultured Amnibacterium sp. TaxID=1631851 RepID=UPI0035CAF420